MLEGFPACEPNVLFPLSLCAPICLFYLPEPVRSV